MNEAILEERQQLLSYMSRNWKKFEQKNLANWVADAVNDCDIAAGQYSGQLHVAKMHAQKVKSDVEHVLANIELDTEAKLAQITALINSL